MGSSVLRGGESVAVSGLSAAKKWNTDKYNETFLLNMNLYVDFILICMPLLQC